jgi:hypothetical protein
MQNIYGKREFSNAYKFNKRKYLDNYERQYLFFDRIEDITEARNKRKKRLFTNDRSN